MTQDMAELMAAWTKVATAIREEHPSLDDMEVYHLIWIRVEKKLGIYRGN